MHYPLRLLLCRANMVGLLNLHTLPSRETFTLIKTLQVGGGRGCEEWC